MNIIKIFISCNENISNFHSCFALVKILMFSLHSMTIFIVFTAKEYIASIYWFCYMIALQRSCFTDWRPPVHQYGYILFLLYDSSTEELFYRLKNTSRDIYCFCCTIALQRSTLRTEDTSRGIYCLCFRKALQRSCFTDWRPPVHQ